MNTTSYFMGASIAVLMVAVMPANAQEPVSRPEVREPNDVITVTAQRREQNLLDVPASVSSITSEALRDSAASRLDDIQFTVPGLSMVEYGPGQGRAQIRGISSSTGLPTIARLLGDVPLNLTAVGSGADVRVFDINRIEVLRGPQGTLFGQGAMGGAIRYLPSMPDLEEVEGYAEAGAFTIEDGGVDYNVEGAVSVPLAPGVAALRVAALYEEAGGWIDNSVSGAENVNSGSIAGVRGILTVKPSEPVELNFTIFHQDSQFDGQNNAGADGTVALNVPNPTESELTLYSADVSLDLGFAEAVSTTAFQDRSTFSVFDLSPFYIPLFEAPPPFGFGFPAGTFQGVGLNGGVDYEVFTQELRLLSQGSNRLFWTVGAFYRDVSTSSATSTTVIPDILPFTVIEGSGTSPSDSESWAVFGEVSYQITPRLEATAGGRYFEDDRVQSSTTSNFGAVATDANQATFDSFSPRFALNYRVGDNASVYASASKGFRSGGFNLQSAGGGVLPIPETYDAEEMWAYEIGGRILEINGVLSLEGAIYFNDWSNIQSSTFVPGSQFTVIENAGAAEAIGVDFVATYEPVESFTLTATLGWIDAEYKESNAAVLAGDPIDFVPEMTASVTAQYRFNWKDGVPGDVRLQYQFQDAYNLTLRNFANSVSQSEEHSLLNASVGADFGAWRIDVHGRNLFNDDAVLFPASGVQLFPVRPQPRSFGAVIRRGF